MPTLPSNACVGSYACATRRSVAVLPFAARNWLSELLQPSSVRIVSPVQLWRASGVSFTLSGRSASSSGASWLSVSGGIESFPDGIASPELSDATGASATPAGRVARTIAVVQPAVAAMSARIASACQPLTRDGAAGGRSTGSPGAYVERRVLGPRSRTVPPVSRRLARRLRALSPNPPKYAQNRSVAGSGRYRPGQFGLDGGFTGSASQSERIGEKTSMTSA